VSFTETQPIAAGVRKLSPKERAWCEELAALLDRAPKRLALYTIGDPSLTVIDAAAERRFYEETGDGCEDGHAQKYGYELGTIYGRIKVHGVSG
jgi:hypothetical protein